jgi:hypothetical protein
MARQQIEKEPGGSAWIESASVIHKSGFPAGVLEIGMANATNLVRSETAFDPETLAVLAAALDEAWSWLQASGSEWARPAYARAKPEFLNILVFL